MQHVERLGRILLIEASDLGDQGRQDALGRMARARWRVREIAQEDELRSRIRIGEIVQLQTLELTPCVMDMFPRAWA